MDRRLLRQAVSKFMLGAAIIALVLFGTAGTLAYWQAWLFMGILLLPMLAAGMVLMVRNPDLLRKRLHAKEKEGDQARLIKLGGVMFFCGFVIAGLGRRFGWMALPKGMTIAAAVVFLLAYLMYAEVLRENTYLSRTVEVQAHQKVIDTGLYGVVRHPMYSATILLFLAIPFVLGSLWAVAVFVVYPAIIAKRIQSEERVLAEGLPGYVDYQKRVKYRLIPFVW